MLPPAYSASMDEAIIKDRIVSDLRSAGGSVPAYEIAARHGRGVGLVWEIWQALRERETYGPAKRKGGSADEG